jgi:hypothetical protein
MASRAQAFYLVVLTSLVCTLTDSALRLLIVLQMSASGFTAMNVAIVVAFNEAVALSTGILIAFLQYKTNAKNALLIGMAFQLCGVRAHTHTTHRGAYRYTDTHTRTHMYTTHIRTGMHMHTDTHKLTPKHRCTHMQTHTYAHVWPVCAAQ